MELGLETEGRNKLVSDFVTATFQVFVTDIITLVILVIIKDILKTKLSKPFLSLLINDVTAWWL